MKSKYLGLWVVGSVLLLLVYFFNLENTLGYSDSTVHLLGGMGAVAIFSKKNLLKKIVLITTIFLLWEILELSVITIPALLLTNPIPDLLYRIATEDPINRITDVFFDYTGVFLYFLLTTSTASASLKSALKINKGGGK